MQIQTQKHTASENPENDKEITTANRLVKYKLCQPSPVSIYNSLPCFAEKGEVVKTIYLDFRKTFVTDSCDSHQKVEQT